MFYILPILPLLCFIKSSGKNSEKVAIVATLFNIDSGKVARYYFWKNSDSDIRYFSNKIAVAIVATLKR